MIPVDENLLVLGIAGAFVIGWLFGILPGMAIQESRDEEATDWMLFLYLVSIAAIVLALILVVGSIIAGFAEGIG